MDIFSSIIDWVFPMMEFENEIFTFVLYILRCSVSCGLLAYILQMIHNILRLSVTAPKTKLI